MPKKPHILVIDNYDSFVHNLARYTEIAGAKITIIRNNERSINQISAIKPNGIILSPGPNTPAESGVCIPLIQAIGSTTPMLGVCLGHQAIGEAYGGTTIRADEPMHGMASNILHDNSSLYGGIPSPFEAGRYHSLITDISDAKDLITTAREAGTGTIMGIQHRVHPVYGVQFHPESILTPHGQKLVQNFIDIVIKWNA